MDDRKLALHFIFNHPPSFANFFGPKGFGRYCRVRLYQEPAFLSEGGADQGGRRWGKTFKIVFKIVHGVFKYPRKESLVAVFRRAHLKNVFEEVVKVLVGVDLFREYLLTGKERESVKRDILHEIKFKNGHTVYAIAVGDDPHAVQIKGRSPRLRFVDEAQDFPQQAANILSSTMDPEGVEEYWGGVVDGRRDTPFYKILEKSKRFFGRVFKFTRRYDPNFKQEDLARAAEDIEGGEFGDKFGQEVDAEHGSPESAVWNIDDVIDCIAKYDFGDATPKLMKHVIVTPRDYRRSGDKDVDKEERNAIFRNIVASQEVTIFGVDVGEAEPTMILPFSLESGMWVCKNRIELRDRVGTVEQGELIEHIVRMFPNVIGIGVDVTNSPAIADVLSSSSEELAEKVVKVRFNSNIIYGFEFIETEDQIQKYLNEGKKVKEGDNIELKQKCKMFTTEILRKMLKAREMLFWHDMELVENFTAESAKMVASGVRIDTPRTVHIPEAMRCFALAHHEKMGDEVKPFAPKTPLFMPRVGKTGFMNRGSGGPLNAR